MVLYYKFILLPFNARKDGKLSVSLKVTKNRKRKYIKTGLAASPEQWDEKQDRFVSNKKLEPQYKDYNALLSEIEAKAISILRDFEFKKIDWTLNQFEDAFLNHAKKGKINDYFENLITTLKETNHVGNAECYSNTLHILKLFDKKFDSKIFQEIDIKYVKAFDVFLQKRGCSGNTRKYYFKALRAVLNKAIQDKEAPESTYPFGKGGFNVAALEEETVKRYLPMDCMENIKSTIMGNPILEFTRRLFLFSYYCYGISFIDMALLTKKNIIRYNGGDYIVYKRNKTKEAKKVKAIQIKITPEIQSHLDWFAQNAILIEEYLVPIISRSGYQGEQLYNHIRSRFGRNNKNLKELAKQLDITELTLTSYVSRHTMAMTLQDNQVPREIISQILGHNDLSTTNTYLDSFSSSIIDEAVKVL
ncbi:Tyrosine recombinase XerD [termite gut metagenome]|uniref:Tyrosine recombinase XerD n=1 Tax=termite gut metagenome TaxID=433724 RepID=A0A5J4S151_9ZZZZ